MSSTSPSSARRISTSSVSATEPGTVADVHGQAEEAPDDAGATAEAGEEGGKFSQLMGILRKAINVKDLSSMRISLPGNLMEPIGNLEAWQ